MPFLLGIALRVVAPGTVAGGDSGELVTAAFVLGPGHPPGYPLWVLLGHLFTLIPAGTAAFRTTLLSCVAYAFSYPLLAYTLERVLEGFLEDVRARMWLAAVVSIFVFTSPLVLAQLQGAEVYALFFLQTALLMPLLLRPCGRNLLLVSFLLGMTLAHHYLVVMVFPVLIAAYWRRIPGLKSVLTGVSLLMLGLTPLLVLALRSKLDPAADWGDPETFTRFLHHVKRTQYMGMGRPDLSAALSNFVHYLSTFLKDTWWIGLVMLAAVRKKGARLWVLGAGMQLIVLPFMLLIEQNPVSYAVIDAYFPPVFLWSAPLIAVGLSILSARLPSRGRALLGAGLVAGTLVHAGWAIGEADASRNLAMERMGRNVLLALPRGAAFYSKGDSPTFGLFHLQKVVGLRPDVTVADRTGGTYRDAYRLQGAHVPDLYGTLTRIEKAWDAANPGRRSFYSEVNGVPGRPTRPFGVVFAVADRDDPGREAEFWKRAVPPGASPRDEFFTRTESGHFHLFRGWWLLRREDEKGARGEFALLRRVADRDSRLLGYLSTVYLTRGWREEAAGVSRDILAFAPGNVDAMFRLGMLASEAGRWEEAERYYRRGLKADPGRQDVRNNLATLLMEAGRREEAAAELARILREDPDHPDAVKNMGLLLWASDPALSKEYFRRYLRLVPDSPEREAIERVLR